MIYRWLFYQGVLIFMSWCKSHSCALLAPTTRAMALLCWDIQVIMDFELLANCYTASYDFQCTENCCMLFLLDLCMCEQCSKLAMAPIPFWTPTGVKCPGYFPLLEPWAMQFLGSRAIPFFACSQPVSHKSGIRGYEYFLLPSISINTLLQ